MEPFSVTLNDACRMIGCGRNLVYNLINDGKLKSFTLGSRRYITVASIKELASEGEDSEAVGGLSGTGAAHS